MMKIWGAGVVGCGAISGNHFHGIQETEAAALRAVCDIDPEKLKKAEQEQGAPGCADWRELIARPDVDAVHVCVPHYLHAEIAVAALKAGKHVLCEKPMGVSLREAQAMEQAARESGRTLTICFQNRFNGASRRMKSIIESGSLGRVLGGSAFVCWDRAGDYYTASPWRGKWATEGGSVLINQAIHTLDLLNWLSGGLQLKEGTMTAKRLAQTIETEDTCDLLLTDEKGGRYIFYCSNCGTGNMPVQMHLNLEKGQLHMNGPFLTISGPEGTATEDYSAKHKVGKDYWGSSHTLLIDDFYRSLTENRAPFVTPESALATMRVMDAAYHAAAPERNRPEE